VEESSSSISEDKAKELLRLAKEEAYSRICKEEILQILYCCMKKRNSKSACACEGGAHEITAMLHTVAARLLNDVSPELMTGVPENDSLLTTCTLKV